MVEKQGSKRGVGKKKDLKENFIDMVTSPILSSIGLVSIAEEEMSKFIKGMIERGEASKKEGEKIFNQFQKKRKSFKKDLETEIEDRVEKLLGKLNVVTKADLKALDTKVKALEKKLTKLSKTGKEK